MFNNTTIIIITVVVVAIVVIATMTKKEEPQNGDNASGTQNTPGTSTKAPPVTTPVTTPPIGIRGRFLKIIDERTVPSARLRVTSLSVEVGAPLMIINRALGSSASRERYTPVSGSTSFQASAPGAVLEVDYGSDIDFVFFTMITQKDPEQRYRVEVWNAQRKKVWSSGSLFIYKDT